MGGAGALPRRRGAPAAPVAALALVLPGVTVPWAALSGRARAEPDDGFARCVAGGLALFEELGARSLGQAGAVFLQAGEAASLPVAAGESTCVGVWAVGRRRVEDVDLAVWTATGVSLAEDATQGPMAYVRYCGAAQMDLRATLRVAGGLGEVVAHVLGNAPAQPPDLSRVPGECFPAGPSGAPTPAENVGDIPIGHSTAEALEVMISELAPLGYRPESPVLRGALTSRASERQSVFLAAGRCYAIVGVAGAGLEDLDLALRVPGGGLAGRDNRRDRDAVVKLCAQLGGVLEVEATAYGGAGEYAVQALALEVPAGAPSATLGAARIGYAETLARLRARGFGAAELGWVLVAPGREAILPVAVEAGRCTALAAVPASELAGADVDLVLVDRDGVRVASDVGPGPTSLLFHCDGTSRTLRAVVRAYGGQGRALLLAGREAP